jgi:hypothetical protein
MPLFEVLSIKDKRILDSRRVQMMVLNAVKEMSKVIKMELNMTTEYWKHRVEFGHKIYYKGGDIRLFVGPIGSRRGAVIWRNINNGTSSIDVEFSKEYVAKTKYPGSIGTNIPGSHTLPSQKIYRKRLFPMPPGIRPRLWTHIISREYGKWYRDAIQHAITKGLTPK